MSGRWVTWASDLNNDLFSADTLLVTDVDALDMVAGAGTVPLADLIADQSTVLEATNSILELLAEDLLQFG